jgi:hypothetical protein
MNEMPRFWKAQIERRLSQADLISSKCKPEAAIIREASAMFTELRMAIVEKSPALLSEEETLP